MLTPQEVQTLSRLRDEIRQLPVTQRPKLLGMAFEAERRMKAIHDRFDRTQLELRRIRTSLQDLGTTTAETAL